MRERFGAIHFTHETAPHIRRQRLSDSDILNPSPTEIRWEVRQLKSSDCAYTTGRPQKLGQSQFSRISGI
jgi:hypothetical protein